MKSKKLLQIIPMKEFPWLVWLKFPYHLELKNYVAQFPSALWKPEKRAWTLAEELVDQVVTKARAYGFEVS